MSFSTLIFWFFSPSIFKAKICWSSTCESAKMYGHNADIFMVNGCHEGLYIMHTEGNSVIFTKLRSFRNENRRKCSDFGEGNILTDFFSPCPINLQFFFPEKHVPYSIARKAAISKIAAEQTKMLT